jgi:hypothetical protein
MFSTAVTLRDTRRQLAAIALLLVSSCLWFLVLLIVWGLVSGARTSPFTGGDGVSGGVFACLAALTGWMAYRILRKRRSSDGRTYLGACFILGFGIVLAALVVLVVIAAPHGVYYLPCALLPWFFIEVAIGILRRK